MVKKHHFDPCSSLSFLFLWSVRNLVWLYRNYMHNIWNRCLNILNTSFWPQKGIPKSSAAMPTMRSPCPIPMRKGKGVSVWVRKESGQDHSRKRGPLELQAISLRTRRKRATWSWSNKHDLKGQHTTDNCDGWLNRVIWGILGSWSQTLQLSSQFPVPKEAWIPPDAEEDVALGPRRTWGLQRKETQDCFGVLCRRLQSSSIQKSWQDRYQQWEAEHWRTHRDSCFVFLKLTLLR